MSTVRRLTAETFESSVGGSVISVHIWKRLLAGVCVCVAWTSCGYHMQTVGISHAHHVDITCKPCGHHMQTMWISHANHVDITCTPCGHHMQTMWISHAHHVVITCKPCGYHMQTMWTSHANHVDITCTPCGYHMYTSMYLYLCPILIPFCVFTNW